jgi:hypothetical protein
MLEELFINLNEMVSRTPGPDVTIHDASPQPPNPDNQPLARLEARQCANLSVLLIDEPKYYQQAKVSSDWADWKKAMGYEIK